MAANHTPGVMGPQYARSTQGLACGGGGAPPRRVSVSCSDGDFLPPVNGRDLEALKAVANGQRVWVNALP